jgi:heme exporter protein CcmD
MMSMDVWMRENPLTYVWLGSYAVALLIFVVEVTMVVRKRNITLRQVRMMRNAGDDE